MSEIKNIIWIEEIEGREKPNFHNVGILMFKDNGKISIKLNTVPVGNFNGWLSVVEQKKKNTETEPF
jgi:hypothetical protein